jgi:predicted outer membrane repeat protein
VALEHGHAGFQGGAISARVWTGRMLRIAVSGSDAGAGAGLVDYSEHFEVRDSTFTGNSAISGGGIASTSHDLAIINSTVNGNTGAGVYAVAEIDLRSSTVTGNSGGGLYFAGTFNGYKARIANSVLAGNAGSDCAQSSAALTVLTVTYSHFDTASGNCDLTGQGNVVDPGATVIDRGDPAGCTDQDGLPLRTDHNGLPRTANGDSARGAICDQGATEAQDEAPVCGPNDLVTDRDTEAAFSIRCSDPEGAPLDYDVVGAAHGTVVGRTYFPDKGYTGPDTITYTVRDDANTVTATISVTVTRPAVQTVVPTPSPTPVAPPVISARPRPKPPVVSGLAAARHGKSLRFKLSAPAKVTIKLVRGKTRKTITVAHGKTGTNTVKLKLKRGRYRVTVTAAGKATATKTLTLG